MTMKSKATMGNWRQKTDVDAVLRRLHFGAVAGEIRARRALAAVESACCDGSADAYSHEHGHYTESCCPLCGVRGADCPDDCPRVEMQKVLAQPPSEPAAALEALLGELEEEASCEGVDAPAYNQGLADAKAEISQRLRKALDGEVER